MRGRSLRRVSAALDQPFSSTRLPRLSSKPSCPKMPKRRSGMVFAPSARSPAQLVSIFSAWKIAMYCSSESIGAIAGALAKAQSELVNPEKSLSGTITVSGPGGGERAFRYAPLSVGPEIVRISLGKHEIATMQTTAIDTDAGLVRLTTVLAHSSGEWVSSEWPVCPVSETASPRRMGAALTYARRYALFTLVGIAGEDDLDAPDMSVPGCPGGPAQSARSDGSGPPSGIRHRNGKASAQPKNVLSSEEAAALREQLLAEVTGLASPEEAAVWAEKVLPLKNALPLGDAQTVEV